MTGRHPRSDDPNLAGSVDLRLERELSALPSTARLKLIGFWVSLCLPGRKDLQADVYLRLARTGGALDRFFMEESPSPEEPPAEAKLLIFHTAKLVTLKRYQKRLRRASHEPNFSDIDENLAQVVPDDALSSTSAIELVEAVALLLKHMPEPQAELLELRFFGGLNSIEIAAILGATPDAIRKRLSRAYAMAHSLAARLGIEPNLYLSATTG